MISLEDVSPVERLQWAETLLAPSVAQSAREELGRRGREGEVLLFGDGFEVVKVCFRAEAGRWRNGYFLRRHVEHRGGAWRIADNDRSKALMVSPQSWDTRADV